MNLRTAFAATVLLTTCFCGLISFPSAQTPSSVMTLLSATGAMTIKYHLFQPTGYNRSVKYPLVLTFHGIGEDGEANIGAIDYHGIAATWIDTNFQKSHPCFVVSPHNPSGTWTGFDYTIANSTGTFVQPSAISTRLSTVMGILDSICKEFNIDTNRIYITGLSIGGFATWDLITRFPKKFAAAIPMSGAVDTSKASRIASLPIWNIHGQVDGSVTALSSRLIMKKLDSLDGNKGVVYPECKDTACTTMPNTRLDSLINAGATHLYSEQQNGGHVLWLGYYSNSRIREWLFKQIKPAPAASRVRPAIKSSSGENRMTGAVLLSADAQRLKKQNPLIRMYDVHGRLFGSTQNRRTSATGVVIVKSHQNASK